MDALLAFGAALLSLRLSGDLDCLQTGTRDGPVVGAAGIEINLDSHLISGASFALIRSGSLRTSATISIPPGASSRRQTASNRSSSAFVRYCTSEFAKIRSSEASVFMNDR